MAGNTLKTAVLVLAFVGIGLGAPVNDPGEDIIDPDQLNQFTTPPPSHQWDDWEDWDTWQARPEIAKWFPYYRSGYDEDGLVVYVMEIGKWNCRELVRKPQEVIDEFWKYLEQFARRAERDGALNKDQGTVIIFDWDRFGLTNYASSRALQMALKMFTSLVRLNHSLKYAFGVNINFSAETFINLSRPFMGNIMEKFELYGAESKKWKPAVLKKISPSQLSPKYGGAKDWKPLPIQVSSP